MIPATVRTVALAVAALACGSCTQSLPLSGAPCPCATGFCCVANQCLLSSGGACDGEDAGGESEAGSGDASDAGSACAWRQLATSGVAPPAAGNVYAVYDPVGKRVLVLTPDGTDVSFPRPPALWALDLDGDPRWEVLIPSSGQYFGTSLLLDGNRLIAFDRVDTGAWLVDLGAAALSWVNLAPPAPAAAVGVYQSSVIVDPGTHRLFSFGGGSAAGRSTNGLFALSLDSPTTWMDLSASFGAPPPRIFTSDAVYSGAAGMVVLESLTDVWSLPLDGGTWSHLLPTGVGPSDTVGRSPVYDSTRRRIIAWGSLTYAVGDVYTDETWTLSLGGSPEWGRLLTRSAPRPPARSGFAAAYDPVGDRLIIFGGNDSQSRPIGDLWMLDLAACD